MKNSKAKKILALVLASLMMVATVASCGEKEKEKEYTGADTLVVGYSNFSEKFSPFFADSAYDQDVASMTQVGLLSTDRDGNVILKGIEGETNAYSANGKEYTYTGIADCDVKENSDGTVDYTITMRDDLKFSDGEPMTIDDAIFSLYVFCDPTFDGSSTMSSLPVVGMADYKNSLRKPSDLILSKMAAEADGEGDSVDISAFVTDEQYATYKAAFEKCGPEFAQSIVDYCLANYADYGAVDFQSSAALWGYVVEKNATGADLFNLFVKKYGYDVSAIEAEAADKSFADMIAAEIGEGAEEYEKYIKTSDVQKIEGLKRNSDYSPTLTLSKVDATAIYQMGWAVAPLHYYGNKDAYNFDNNQFGFTKGDLSAVREKTTKPMGAGPYKFVKFENGVVNFEANDKYYLGAPKTKYVNFREVQDQDKLNGVVTGTIDITDPSFHVDAAAAISKENGGELTGDKITTSTVDNLGYGYIGINSHNVCVGDDPASEESKNLRRAFATIFSVYRDVAIDSYYGEVASVINYPISNTSWAAPQPTDDGYEIAFSKDVDGNPIYTSDMDTDAKYEAAKAAALGFFEAAGYTVDGGKVTAAPEGAKMEYEVQIPADGSGDHPSFMILTLAKDALAELGINLIVTDLTNSSDLWTGLEAGQVEMWCAAWGATVDPDMYQIYYSDVANGGAQPGGSNYMYKIEDEELDSMILEARESTDQEYRKAMYKACLDTIIDWACEIPVYQRQNAIIFSTERVNIDTVTPDITTFYGWMQEIQNIEMR